MWNCDFQSFHGVIFIFNYCPMRIYFFLRLSVCFFSKQTRILVTHGVSFLPHVDEIVVLKDGVISEVGSYNTLRSSRGAFSEFLNTYAREQSNRTNSESGKVADTFKNWLYMYYCTTWFIFFEIAFVPLLHTCMIHSVTSNTVKLIKCVAAFIQIVARLLLI